jgi:predicted nucleotidyltransferase/biotin operon repressor
MDTYKLKFTRLQNEILRFLFIKSGRSFNQRALARALKVSPTAIAKALEELEKDGLVNIDKDTNHLSIELNTQNPDIFWMKRAENLKLLHESGLVGYLSEQFPGGTIILFGSYAFGEDTVKSDIDIAIIGCNEKNLPIVKFEEILERTIVIQYYRDLSAIDRNLRSSILNGIILHGAVEI